MKLEPSLRAKNFRAHAITGELLWKKAKAGIHLRHLMYPLHSERCRTLIVPKKWITFNSAQSKTRSRDFLPAKTYKGVDITGSYLPGCVVHGRTSLTLSMRAKKLWAGAHVRTERLETKADLGVRGGPAHVFFC